MQHPLRRICWAFREKRFADNKYFYGTEGGTANEFEFGGLTQKGDVILKFLFLDNFKLQNSKYFDEHHKGPMTGFVAKIQT